MLRDDLARLADDLDRNAVPRLSGKAAKLGPLARGDLRAMRQMLGEEAGSSFDVHISNNVNNIVHPVDLSQSGSSVHPASGFLDPAPLWEQTGLTVVGTGIRAGFQTTPEARSRIANSKKVLYLVADVVAERWIQGVNPRAESLGTLYTPTKNRMDIYEGIVSRITEEVDRHGDVCAVFYGHPGSFVYPAREAIRRLRIKGIPARMLPGVSADANLLSDLGVDAGAVGLQSYDATAFFVHGYRFDPRAGLVLWQVGIVGDPGWGPRRKAPRANLRHLADYLARFYPRDHEVAIYEAAEIPLGNPVLIRVPLRRLHNADVTGISTLYVPPLGLPGPKRSRLEALGLPVASGPRVRSRARAQPATRRKV